MGKGPQIVATSSDSSLGRILILFPHCVVSGGALTYVAKLAESLARKGAAVGVLVMLHQQDTFPPQSGIEVITVNGPLTSSMSYWCLFPYWQYRINRIIDRWQPDLILPQVFPSNWWGWLYRRRHSVPLLWVCHEPSAFIHSDAWIEALKPRWKSLIARVLQPVLSHFDLSLSRHSDCIIANSRFTSREVERIYGMRPAAVAYPPVDAEFFSPGHGERDEAIITVAALSRFKRVDFLLRVFARLLQSHPRLIYHIVGKGDEEARLKALAHALGVSDNVIFHGAVSPEALRDLYRRSLIFLHGGISEPFGLAPVEAIACGTPVVAHRSGGPEEYVSESCGRLVEGVGEDEWAKAVKSFLCLLKANPDYFRAVPGCARPFSWPHNFDSLLKAVEAQLELVR